MIARLPDTLVYVLLGGVVVVGLALIGWALAVLLHWLDPIFVQLFGSRPT